MTVTQCIKPNPEDINLEDCLACSGCITEDEIEGFRPDKIDFTGNLSFVLSPYSKGSIFKTGIFGDDYYKFEQKLGSLLRKLFTVDYIIDSSNFYMKNTTNIDSECPAVVLYVQRVFKTLNLSVNPTMQQSAIAYLKSKNIKTIVSVSQCYDKKMEIDSTVKFIGTKDLLELIKVNYMEYDLYEIDTLERTKKIELEPINGLKEVLNYLRINKGVKPLRICKNGCVGGPAQNIKNFTMNFGHNFNTNFKGPNRIFKSKRKDFNVEW